MKIIGLDALVFGVENLEECAECLVDYGLKACDVTASGGRFEALDGTAIVLRKADDASLPLAIGPAPSIRETIYGVEDSQTLEQIADELGKDRSVTRGDDGSVHSVDDCGFAIGFQLTQRRPIDAPEDLTNAPGHPPQRPANQLGIDFEMAAEPRTLSHVVFFVPDSKKAEAFYKDRLQFVTTDAFADVGPFMRAPAMEDHHALFFIQTPPHMQGVEHFTFHMGSGTEVLLAGTRFAEKGYTSFWGPGRHLLGSNWFWYFNSPLGCHIEYDADMDIHDDQWEARVVPMSVDTSQLFLFSTREKWAPGGPPAQD